MTRLAILVALGAALCLTDRAPVTAADHGDMKYLGAIGRTDAQITDFYAFVHGDNLVLALCTDPAIPPSVTQYLYPSDLTLEFNIDRHSKVTFDNIADYVEFGGTIVTPQNVVTDCRLQVTFDENGVPNLKTTGIAQKFLANIQLFAGLRDDPFIRTPRMGHNVAAVVIELPLEAVAKRDQTLLLWTTSSVPDVKGTVGDHGGRALRSMFIDSSNVMTPQQQCLLLDMVPDVIILDPTQPSCFPNGRRPTDDVVELVVDIPINGGKLPKEDPHSTVNDVPFLPDFPYLPPPHAPPAP